MQISTLETLAAIKRENSFSRVAQIRNMTLSAVSMQIKSLEEELGVILFDRAFRPPKLTPLGEQIAEDAKAITEKQAIMRARCMQTEELTGTIRIGFVPSSAARILPDFLEVANRRATQAKLEMTTGLSEQLCSQVRHGQLDAAVVTDIAEETFDLKCEVLVQEEMVVAAPLNAQADSLVGLSKTLPFIHFVPSSGIGKVIARYAHQMQLEPNTVLNLDSIEAIVRCVQNGIGYSLLPRPDVERYGGDQIVILPCAPKQLFRNISLVTRDDALAKIWRPHLLKLFQSSLPRTKIIVV